MNKLTAIAALSGAALVLCCAASCNKAETPAPEVKVTVAGVTMNSVSFTVSATNAAECSYLVVGADETVPTASAILADGTSVDLADASEIVAEGLEPSTEYTVAVAVSSEDGQTAVATANATTEADPAIVMDSATGRHYGSGSNWGMTLSGEVDGKEYQIALDLYDDASVDAGYVTEGVYTVAPDGSDGTISPVYSSVDILDTADYSNYHYTLSSGTLEVKIADGGYALRLDVVLNDGSSLVVVYNGPVDGIEIAA